MPNKTKIICTMGPAVGSYEKILEIIDAGMNVARLNFSHGTHEQHGQVIEWLKKARRQRSVPLAIMVDTKGPEIRLGKIQENLLLVAGDRWKLVKEAIIGDSTQVSINPGYILDRLTIGQKVLFNDGFISSQVIEVKPGEVSVLIENGGVISTGKGVNVPGIDLGLPAVTEQDILDIRFAAKMDVDLIAASFVRSVEHVITIKKLLADEKHPEIMVIAKIENSEGVQNFESIVQVADGIMIARGDLGVEVPLSQVPKLQKMMIRKSYLAGKPAVTATQMLESMIHHLRPTRAEVSDVANAIYDSTSCVMLSGETAVGKYPIEAVYVMRSVIKEAEVDFDYHGFFDRHASIVYHDVPSSVTLACVKTAYASNAQAIFAFTHSGATARLLSRLRPAMPIVAMTSNEKSYHQMAFNWGVNPFLHDADSLMEAFDKISTFALEKTIVSNGDLVVVSAGSPFGISGTTNMMLVESIGDVLIRGDSGFGERVYGTVSILLTPELRQPFSLQGHILVIPRFDESFLPFLKEAQGVILQNHVNDIESENFLKKIAMDLNKPILLRADGAFHVLKEGQLVTLVPEKAIVYKGVVL